VLSLLDTVWTVDDIPDQTGRTAVVTGGTSGLGLETAAALAAHGARVVLTARDPGRGRAALATIRARVPDADVTAGALDVADLASVRAFAGSLDRVDLLVNNAGVMFAPRGRTADGFETTFGTNHLGPFALTGLLLPLLRERPGSRVVTVASTGHRAGRIVLDDLNWERRRYDRYRAYFQSKLANLLFAFELDRRLTRAGAPTESLAAHPGAARSNLGHGWPGPVGRLTGLAITLAGPFLLQSAAQGALPQLRAATDPGVPPGSYLGPDGPGERTGSPIVVGSSQRARDERTAAALWERSVELTGVDPGM
jgi:NAD(P)-dependent dehydrogenase (short-subunit alcohol dehydrogenase family)